ncbi:hypothetical protein ccbrp13_47160 [Ktedonobacteria bacterium brp13]|nr:hypothetical protein ccbrp13_47160 [Ktedonobacteria bacterium brp13]
MLMIIAIIFLCLLFGFVIGWLLLRRMLLPSIKVKMPADVVSSWTRTYEPDDTDSPNGFGNMNETQTAGNTFSALTTADNGTGTFSGGFVPSPQIFPPNNADMTSTNTKAVQDLPAINTDNPWYTVSDEPFVT